MAVITFLNFPKPYSGFRSAGKRSKPVARTTAPTSTSSSWSRAWRSMQPGTGHAFTHSSHSEQTAQSMQRAAPVCASTSDIGGSISAKSRGAGSVASGAAWAGRRVHIFWRASTCSLSTTGRRSSKPERAPPVSQRSIMCAARRPSPTARVMSVGPVTTSPAAKMPVAPREERVAVDGDLAVAPGGEQGGERLGIRDHADRRDDEIGLEQRLAPGDRLGPAAAGRVRCAELHPLALEATERAVRSRHDVRGSDEEGEGDALALRVRDLRPVRRHLVARPPVGDRDARRAEAARGPRGVHRDVPAADDHDALPGEALRAIESDVAEEREPAHDGRMVLAGDPHPGRDLRPDRHEDRVEPVASQRGEVVHAAVRGDLDAERRDVADVCLHDVGREAIGGDGEAEEAARLRSRLEDLDRVALAGELPGGREPGRAGAHDRDALAGGRRDGDAGAVMASRDGGRPRTA